METMTITPQQEQVSNSLVSLVKKNNRFGDVINLSTPIRIDWFNDSIVAIEVFDDDLIDVYMSTPGELFWFDIEAEIMEQVYADLEKQFAS